jgi:hypothetical protein
MQKQGGVQKEQTRRTGRERKRELDPFGIKKRATAADHPD